jgi:hypothetical protein
MDHYTIKRKITNHKFQITNNIQYTNSKLQTICPLHIAGSQVSSLFIGRDGVIGEAKIRPEEGFVILVIVIWNLFVICLL